MILLKLKFEHRHKSFEILCIRLCWVHKNPVFCCRYRDTYRVQLPGLSQAPVRPSPNPRACVCNEQIPLSEMVEKGKAVRPVLDSCGPVRRFRQRPRFLVMSPVL